MHSVITDRDNLRESEYSEGGRANLDAYMDSPYVLPYGQKSPPLLPVPKARQFEVVVARVHYDTLLKDHNTVMFKLTMLEKEHSRVSKELKKVVMENTRIYKARFKLMELEAEHSRVNKELRKADKVNARLYKERLHLIELQKEYSLVSKELKKENARLQAMSCGSVCQHDIQSSVHDNGSVSLQGSSGEQQTLAQRWLNVSPASQTMGPHYQPWWIVLCLLVLPWVPPLHTHPSPSTQKNKADNRYHTSDDKFNTASI